MGVVAVVLFLLWVNFAPFLARLVLGQRLGRPLDGGATAWDGQPLLGPHKTARGVVAGVAAGALVGPLLGVGAAAGSAAGLAAMAGDLATSFLKRRLKYSSGLPRAGLDQFLEGALPLAVLYPSLELAPWQALLALALFVPVSFAGSAFWHYVLYRPPGAGYPRIVRATTRLREWRACHAPLARWQTWLNFESYV